eukprot:m.14021 g.14021  ORF g.14021 m.14021 type:complete len:66 (-) comp4242_c0_seq1:98-295(-)
MEVHATHLGNEILLMETPSKPTSAPFESFDERFHHIGAFHEEPECSSTEILLINTCNDNSNIDSY